MIKILNIFHLTTCGVSVQKKKSHSTLTHIKVGKKPGGGGACVICVCRSGRTNASINIEGRRLARSQSHQDVPQTESQYVRCHRQEKKEHGKEGGKRKDGK